MATSWEMTPGA